MEPELHLEVPQRHRLDGVHGHIHPAPGCRDLEACIHLQMEAANRLEAVIWAKIPGRLWRCSMAKVAAFDLWRGELRWHGWKTTLKQLPPNWVAYPARRAELSLNWKTWPEIVASLALDEREQRARVRGMEVGP